MGRHLWVALRKLRYQGDYGFLIEADDGRVRLRGRDGPVFTTPRIDPVITFLKDCHLVDADGLTGSGSGGVAGMKLCDRFAERGYHTSVATTFGVDFDAYESIVLARLRGAGCRNNLLVADARMITLALSDVAALPMYAGSRYTVRGSGAANGGVFHPKLFSRSDVTGGA